MTHTLELIVVRFDQFFFGPGLVDVVFAGQSRKVCLVRVPNIVVRIASLHLIELGKGALKLLFNYLLLICGELELEMDRLACLATLSRLIERQG